MRDEGKQAATRWLLNVAHINFKRAGVEACVLFFDNVDVVKTNVLEK
jgi:hypothetical protein